MTYFEILIKGQRVYESCTTEEQLETGRKYTKLLVSNWCRSHPDSWNWGNHFNLGDSMRCLRETKRKELLDVQDRVLSAKAS